MRWKDVAALVFSASATLCHDLRGCADSTHNFETHASVESHRQLFTLLPFSIRAGGLTIIGQNVSATSQLCISFLCCKTCTYLGLSLVF